MKKKKMNASALIARVIGASTVGMTLLPAFAQAPTFIHSQTFAGQQAAGWSRDGSEIEAVMMLSCKDPNANQEALAKAFYQRLHNNRYNVFRDRIETCELCEAFSAGYNLDEWHWEPEFHAVREQTPNIWLTIESGRFEATPDGARALTLGRDLMDDMYFDDDQFRVVRNGYEIRARKRADSWNPNDAPSMRRLLVGLKGRSSVDPILGIKTAPKLDMRDDGADPASITGLFAAVGTGFVSWNGSPEVLKPVQQLYTSLTAAAPAVQFPLPDQGQFLKVLNLQPKAFIRSLRSRYHLNEAPLNAVQGVMTNGSNRVSQLLAVVQALPAADQPKVARLTSMLKAMLDSTGFAQLSNLPLAQVQAVLQNLANPAATADELEQKRIVSQAVNNVMHQIGAEIKNVLPVLTKLAQSPAAPGLPEQFRNWQYSKDATIRTIRTFDKYYSLHSALIQGGQANPQAVAEFNAYGTQQRAAGRGNFVNFQPVTAEQFVGMGWAIYDRMISIWGRQIEAAGSAAVGVWFDVARRFYIPNSRRVTSNFYIDSTDFTGTFLPVDMENTQYSGQGGTVTTATVVTPINQITSANDPTDNHIARALFQSQVSNDVQIELGQEAQYTQRIAELKAAGQDSKGAEWIFNQYLDNMSRIGNLKRTHILRAMQSDRFARMCSQWDWAPVTQSKGETALRALSRAAGLPTP